MSASPFSQTRFRTIFIALMIGLGIVQAVLLHWYATSWKQAGIDSGVSVSITILLCFAIVNGLRYYLPEKNSYAYAMLWSLSLATIGTFITRYLVLRIQPDYEFILAETLIMRLAITILIATGMALSIIFSKQQEEVDENEKRLVETEQLAKDAELFKLRHQLQPHFLFNSLNSISSLITSRPEDARNMIHQLSEFLRGSLRKEDRDVLSLSEELHYLDLYLSIEKVRFGHRLQAEIINDESVLSMKLPAMLLQPLVENAIKFGLYDTTDAVHIRIEAKAADKMLILSVQNPFDAETVKAVQRTGFGLASIQRRLLLLYGRNDLLNTSTEQNTFVATIKIPQS